MCSARTCCLEITLFSVIIACTNLNQVRNYGLDGSGARGGKMPEDNIILNQGIDKKISFEFEKDIKIEENKLIKKYLREHFLSPYYNRNKTFYRFRIYLYIFKLLCNNRLK